MEKCFICFEIKELDKISLSCEHKACRYCINTWSNINNTCPMCRKSIEVSNENYQRYKLYNTYNMQVTPEKYICDWKYTNCLKSNHCLEISKPFGVVIRCVDCGNCQAYNWKN